MCALLILFSHTHSQEGNFCTMDHLYTRAQIHSSSDTTIESRIIANIYCLSAHFIETRYIINLYIIAHIHGSSNTTESRTMVACPLETRTMAHLPARAQLNAYLPTIDHNHHSSSHWRPDPRFICPIKARFIGHLSTKTKIHGSSVH